MYESITLPFDIVLIGLVENLYSSNCLTKITQNKSQTSEKNPYPFHLMLYLIQGGEKSRGGGNQTRQNFHTHTTNQSHLQLMPGILFKFVQVVQGVQVAFEHEHAYSLHIDTWITSLIPNKDTKLLSILVYLINYQYDNY